MELEVVDPFYKQNLSEWIYDQHKLITYQWLSVNLKVHVNLAKQMLYEFYHEEKSKSKTKSTGHQLHALYYISGLKSIGTHNDDDHDQVAYVGLICKEEQLDSLKKEFSSISSVHIYGLEEVENTSEMDTLDRLGQAMKEISFVGGAGDEEDECLISKFGPFKQIEPTKKNYVPEPQPVSSAPVVKHEKKLQEVSNNSKVKTSSIFAPKAKPPTQKNQGQGTLDFSKTKKTERKPEVKIENNDKEVKPVIPKHSIKSEVKRNLGRQLNGSSSKSNGHGKKKQEVEKSRKRIRVISSSSESEDEKVESEDSDSDDFQKHKKRKQYVVPDSSDEEDSCKTQKDKVIEIDDEEPLPVPKKSTIFYPAPKSKSKPTASENGTAIGKRRKKMKVIIREYEDEEGYRVTKKEQVMVSESESEGEPDQKGKEFHSSKEVPEMKVKVEDAKQKNQLTSPPTSTAKQSNKKPPRSSSSASSSVVQKQKQTNIMSFFKKQPV